MEVDLLRGDSRLIGGNAGSGLGATGRQDAYLYASDMRSLGGELTVGSVFWFVLNDGWGEDTADFRGWWFAGHSAGDEGKGVG